jgi:LAO/AO transport system kinase
LWKPTALTCSGLTGDGVDRVWAQVLRHREVLEEAGLLAHRRAEQRVAWMWSMVEAEVLQRLRGNSAVRRAQQEVETAIESGELTASLGAQRILDAFDQG